MKRVESGRILPARITVSRRRLTGVLGARSVPRRTGKDQLLHAARKRGRIGLFDFALHIQHLVRRVRVGVRATAWPTAKRRGVGTVSASDTSTVSCVPSSVFTRTRMAGPECRLAGRRRRAG